MKFPEAFQLAVEGKKIVNNKFGGVEFMFKDSEFLFYAVAKEKWIPASWSITELMAADWEVILYKKEMLVVADCFIERKGSDDEYMRFPTPAVNEVKGKKLKITYEEII
jgi:hypothetical protein